MNEDAENTEEPRILQCIFCRAQLLFQGPSPPKRYINHLRSQHDIIYQSEVVIEETLRQQFPELATKKPKEDCDCSKAKKQKESEIHRPPSLTANPSDYNPAIARNIKKEIGHSEPALNSSFRPAANSTPKGPSVQIGGSSGGLKNQADPNDKPSDQYKPSITSKPGPKSRKPKTEPEANNALPPPSNHNQPIGTTEDDAQKHSEISAAPVMDFEDWKTGTCKWTCKECNEKFPHSLECWSHITTLHKYKIQDYNNKYGSPCVEENFHVCKLCNSNVRHDLGHLKKHILKKHSFSLEQYYDMYVKNAVVQSEATTDDDKVKMAKVNVKVERITDEEKSMNANVKALPPPQPPTFTPPVPVNPVSDKREIEQSFDNLLNMISYMDNNLANPDISTVALNKTTVPGINKSMPPVADDLIRQMKQCNEKSREEDLDDVECSPDISAMVTTEMKPETEVAVKAEEQKIPWMWGTLLECKLCEKQFLEQIDFKHHLDSGHQMDFDKYVEEQGDPTLVSNFHECLVCGRGILHSPKSIRAHLTIHKMTTTAYYDKNKEEIDGDIPEIPLKDESLIKRMNNQNNPAFRLNPLNPHAPTGLLDPTVEGQVVDLKWLDQCTYGCVICPNKPEFKHYNKMKHHLLDEHNKMTILIYTKEHGPIFAKDVWHACQICCAIVKWSPNQLGHHVTNIHKIKLVEYRATYMPSYSDCPSVETGNITDDQAKWMTKSIFDCEACPKATDEEKIYYDKVRNTLTTRKKLNAHLLKDHKLEASQYTKDYKIEASDLLVGKNTILHKCKLCDKNVRWDQDSLMIHLTAMHSMSPQEYEEKYMKNYQMDSKVKLGDSTRTSSHHHSLSQESSWSNKCLFECKVCFNTFQSRGVLINHFKKTHNITWQYHEMYFGESLFQRRVILCQLCNKSIQWDSYHLISHMGDQHKTKILDYKKDYVESYVDAKENESIPESEVWMYKCEYGCKICKKKFLRRSNFFYHLTVEHTMEKQVYSDQHGDIEFSKKFHNCQICMKEVLWDGKNLKKHLSSHNVLPAVYYEKFINSNQGKRPDEQMLNLMDKCSFMCSKCSKVSNNKHEMIIHVQEQHSNDEKSSMTEGFSAAKHVLHTCMLCQENISWDRYTLENHVKTHKMALIDYVKNKLDAYKENEECLKKHKENSDWMNGSLYECVSCQNRVFSKKSTMLSHIHEAHKDVEDKMSLRRTTKAASHICQICGSSLEWDSGSLRHHFKRRHSIIPDVYHATFMENYTTDVNLIQERMTFTKKLKVDNGEEVEEVSKVKAKSGYIPKGPPEFWSAKCKFECKICFISTNSRKAISNHLKERHEINTMYHEEHFGPTLLDKSMLVCAICSKEQIWDSYFLIAHLRKYHKINLTAYKKEHVDGFHKADDDLVPDEEKWLCMSELACKICSTVYTNRNKFYQHIKNEHSMEVKDYKAKHGNHEFSKKFHICQICKREMNWDKGNITHHLGTHNISVEAYYKQYMGRYNITEEKDMISNMNKCVFVCKLCNKLFNANQKLIEHVQKDHEVGNFHQEYESVHQDSVAKLVLHTCVLCKENILWDKDAMEMHLKQSHAKSLIDYIKVDLPNYTENEECAKKHKENSDWMNGCEYQCIAQDCNMIFFKKDSWQWHTYNHKDITDKDTIKRVLKTTVHTCQICLHPDIEWDSSTIKYHLESKHSIQPDMYFAKYMHNYSPDTSVIKERQAQHKEHRRRQRDQAQENQDEEEVDENTEEELSGLRSGAQRSRQIEVNYEDDDEWRSEEAKIWAKGCLYFCEPCDGDFAGIKDFSFHLVSKHKTSFTRHCAKYQMKYVNIKKNFHFCKLCHKNVNHDEDDLAKHFRKEHEMSGSDYFEQFKAKLKRPRLDRPEGFKPSSAIVDTNSDTSQDAMDIQKTEPTVVPSINDKKNMSDVNQNKLAHDDTTKLKETNKNSFLSHFPPSNKLTKDKYGQKTFALPLAPAQKQMFNTMKPILEPLKMSAKQIIDIDVDQKKKKNINEDEKQEDMVSRPKKLKLVKSEVEELPLM